MKKTIHLLILMSALLLFCSSTFAEDHLEVGEAVELSVKELGSFSITVDGIGMYPAGDNNGMLCISVRCVIDNQTADSYNEGYLSSFSIPRYCMSVIDQDGFACTYSDLLTPISDGAYEINPRIKIGEKKRAGLLFFISPETTRITVNLTEKKSISFVRSDDLFTPSDLEKVDMQGTDFEVENGKPESEVPSDGSAELAANAEASTVDGLEEQLLEDLKARLEALEKRETQLESEVQALMDEAVDLKQHAEPEPEPKPSSGMSDGPAGLTDEEQILQAAVSAYWHLFSFAEDPRSIRIISMCTYKDSIIIDSIGKEFDGTYVRYLHQYFADTDTLESLGRPDRVSDEYKIGSKKTAPVDSARILAFSKSDRCRGYYISSGVFITEEEAEALQKGLIAEDTAGSTK